MTTDTRRKVAIDIETTGLDHRQNEVIEIAWMVDGSFVRTYRPSHTLQYAQPKALEINRYFERAFRTDGSNLGWEETRLLERDLLRDLTGASLIVANPSFDVPFLTGLLGYAPWHHRIYDIESMAFQQFDGLEEMPGQAKVAELLRAEGYEIPQPDHTAGGDVLCLWACYQALLDLRTKRQS